MTIWILWLPCAEFVDWEVPSACGSGFRLLHSLGIKRCALLFFGVPRGFRDYCLPSIRKFILDVNPGCDVYVHTYNISNLTSPRSREINAPIYPSDVLLLSPNMKLVMDTDTLGRNVTYYRRYYPQDKMWMYPSSIDNMIKQWHSIERVWEVMEGSGVHYSRVGLFRLDVQYIEPIDISAGRAVVPGWQYYWGFNDRMFFGEYEYAKVWATRRFPQVETYAEQSIGTKELHSETYLKWVMRNVPITKTNKCFRRVRANGLVVKEDCPGKTN
jgi:hypothetical protein